jgi:hypothetical protein
VLAGHVGSADPTTAAATAAFAAAQALAALDSVVGAVAMPPTVESVLEIDPHRGTTRRRSWPPHPHCSRGAADNRPSPLRPATKTHRRRSGTGEGNGMCNA